MTIVKAPHHSLRSVAQPITTLDHKVESFLEELGQTLVHNPRSGVGLAAPQVNKPWRAFITYLNPANDEARTNQKLNYYLNPQVVHHSPNPELGGDKDSPPLEGCLSIPNIWGPVPRFSWLEIEFEIVEKGNLVSHRQHFEGFPARVVQHELDHLDGILFTDYSLMYDLPIYTENLETKKMEELSDRSIIEIF